MLMNHLGHRYYEEGKGTPDLALTMMNMQRGKLLKFIYLLFVALKISLLLLWRWIVAKSSLLAQQAKENFHPQTAWKAPNQPECSGCGKKQEAGGKTLKRCARCKVALYCSKACQKEDYKAHKKACAGLANAAASEEAEKA
jgi:hypothetical protein